MRVYVLGNGSAFGSEIPPLPACAAVVSRPAGVGACPAGVVLQPDRTAIATRITIDDRMGVICLRLFEAMLRLLHEWTQNIPLGENCVSLDDVRELWTFSSALVAKRRNKSCDSVGADAIDACRPEALPFRFVVGCPCNDASACIVN